MSFTDDDLKRLKDAIIDRDMSQITGLGFSRFVALLARLEAAEKCLEPSAGNEIPARRYEAWRKAAGK